MPGIKEILSGAVIMSADTRQVLDEFRTNIADIKQMLDELNAKIDAHIEEEALDLKTVRAHLAEAVELMREFIKD